MASFAAAMTEAKARIHYCSICGNFTESDICEICADRQRTSEVLCVVRDPRDIMAMERTRDYRGDVYKRQVLDRVAMKKTSPTSVSRVRLSPAVLPIPSPRRG